MNSRPVRSLVAAVLLLVSARVLAQESAPRAPEPARTTGLFDFIGRGTIFGSASDEARFERYRDLRDGGTLDMLRYTRDTDSRRFTVQADHVGYRDQRYAASYTRFGALKASFEWNQTPLFFSNSTATLFTTDAPGVLRTSDAIQSGVQNRSATVAVAGPCAHRPARVAPVGTAPAGARSDPAFDSVA